MKYFISAAATLVLIFLCSFIPTSKLRQGFWKAIIERSDGEQIVFNFETKIVNKKQVMYVINGAERMLVDSFEFEKDSVFFQMPFFESGFRALIRPDGNLSGTWVKQFANRTQYMPFKAYHNVKERFAAGTKPAYDLSGRWSVLFHRESDRSTPAIGEFVQKGNSLTGSFLTPSGDYRYLQGIVSGDSMIMSGFDGGFAHLFKAKIESGKKLTNGRFISGPFANIGWQAERDPNISLPDEYDQTHMKLGEIKLPFSFPDLDGNTISELDNRFQNKVLIVQIFGSWCPNCMDETKFLTDIYNRYQSKGLEIVGLAYERTTEKERSLTALKKYQQRFNVQYPLLWTGVAVGDSLRTEKTLPQLDNIKVFPTTVMISRKGQVVKIHSGFSGPGTGVHHENYKKEFTEMLERLLNEKAG